MVVRIQEGGTGQTTAPGARIALGLSDQNIIDIVGTPAGAQPLDSDLTAIAALSTTAFGRAFLTIVDAAGGRTYLGLGTMATETAANYLTTASAAATYLTIANAAATYQPVDSDLTAIAALTTTSYGRGLLELADATAARAALSLGTMATETAANYLTIASAATTYLPLAGGTLTGGLVGTTADFSGLLTTNGQIAFPATANPSADANTLDDYEEGTWTPTLTFTTPGNLSVVYSVRVGTYTKIGNMVTLTWGIATTTWTHTTASGNVTLTGAPFTAATVGNGQWTGVLSESGFVTASGNFWTNRILPTNSTIEFVGNLTTGGGRALATTTHATSGTQQGNFGTLTYQAA